MRRTSWPERKEFDQILVGVNLNQAKRLPRAAEAVAANSADVGEAASVVEGDFRTELEFKRGILALPKVPRMTPASSECLRLMLKRTCSRAEGTGTRGLRFALPRALARPSFAKVAVSTAHPAIGMTDRSAVPAIILILLRKVTSMINTQIN
jgi:hypothetical protein